METGERAGEKRLVRTLWSAYQVVSVMFFTLMLVGIPFGWTDLRWR